MSEILTEQQYSPAQVAELLSVHPKTVLQWIGEGLESRGRKGLYPVVKLGARTVRVPASAVNRMLERRRMRAL